MVDEKKTHTDVLRSKDELTQQELVAIRKMIEWFRAQNFLGYSLPEASTELIGKDDMLSLFQSVHIQVSEQKKKKEFQELLWAITSEKMLLQILLPLSSVFPLKYMLRHAPVDQKLFMLTALGEKYLASMSGIWFTSRKKLFKLLAEYFTELSDRFCFLQTEGDIFDSKSHERLSGTSPTGLTIREMRSFLVIDSNTKQVVSLSRVIT